MLRSQLRSLSRGRAARASKSKQYSSSTALPRMRLSAAAFTAARPHASSTAPASVVMLTRSSFQSTNSSASFAWACRAFAGTASAHSTARTTWSTSDSFGSGGSPSL